MRKLLALAALLAIVAMAHADIVINEIMYNTPGYDNEWVELYNSGDTTVDLAGWWLVDDDAAHTPLVIPTNMSVAAGGYFTIAIDHHEQADPFPFTPDFDGIAVCEWNLGNGSDEINLYDSNSNPIDSVPYDDGDPWPTSPDGDGPSLELINPDLDNSVGTSWQGSEADGGSPGEANSSMNAPVLSITPSEIDYGYVVPGQTYSIDMHLENIGTTTLTITDVTIPDTGEFMIDQTPRLPLPYDIAPGSGWWLTLQCTPNAVRDIIFEGEVVFEGNIDTYNLPVTYTIDTEETGAVINEIMYNSPSYDNEWLELYNMDNTAFSLEGFTLIDDDTNHTPLAFPTGASIPANGYYTVALYHDSQADPFPFTPDYDATEICEWNLNNTSDTIYLYDADGAVWDQVTFFDTTPWPSQPDGNGPSLELIDPSYDNNVGESWQASNGDGGTPGAENSTSGGNVTVATVAELRQQEPGNTVYTLTGEAILTFQQSFRHQKYLQDDTGGILIDDDPGAFTTVYALGDGISGITGVLTEYGNMLEFQPTEDPGDPTSTGNTVIPEVVTVNDLATDFDSYESELITIVGLTFDDTGVFANGTTYACHDATGDFTFRTTFYDVDYVGTDIPTGTINVTAIPNSRSEGDFITARNLADFSSEGPVLNTNTDALAFGGVMLNETVYLPLLLASAGTETVNVSNISSDNTAFVAYADEAGTALTFPIEMAPTNTVEIYVAFTPSEVMTYAGNLTIEGNMDDVVVTLQGSGSLGLADIVINEIMYNPSGDQGDDDYYEWLEIYNNEDTDVDLSNWAFTSGIEYTFDAGTILTSGGYLVIAIAPDSIAAAYGITNVVGPYSGGLNNTGELVQLSDNNGDVIDFVEYADSAPWPTAPDGNGPSLELVSPEMDNAFADNWQSSFDQYGTPGAENTEAPNATTYTIYEIQYSETGPSPHVGERIYTEGVVTAVFEDIFFIQDGEGAWNGVCVEGTGVNEGDEINLTATVVEYYSRTMLSEIDDLNVTGTADLPPFYIGTTGELADSEAYEGVLVRVSVATVTNDSLGYGEWEINDNSGALVVGDEGSYTYTPILDAELDVRGPLDYSYSFFKIEPRDDDDIHPAGAVGGDSPVAVTGISGNYPNPFNPETTVVFSLAQPGRAELKIYNIRGQLVKTLVSDNLDTGEHTIVWRGDNNDSAPVASGLYLMRLQTPQGSDTHKALLLK